MPSFVELLFCYGLCFGMMNKLPFLHGRAGILDRLLSCSYCCGFHCGWIACLLVDCIDGAINCTPQMALAWALTSSASCYMCDIVSQAIEASVRE